VVAEEEELAPRRTCGGGGDSDWPNAAVLPLSMEIILTSMILSGRCAIECGAQRPFVPEAGSGGVSAIRCPSTEWTPVSRL